MSAKVDYADTASTKNNHKHYARVVIALGLFLSILFFSIMIYLLNITHANGDLPIVDTTLTEDNIFPALDRHIRAALHQMFNEHSMFCYEIVLAGILGSFLQQLSKDPSTEERDGRGLLTALFFGGALSIILGILFPLVLGLGKEFGTEQGWALVAFGGIAGTQAHRFFAGTQTTLERLLRDYQSGVDSIEISRAVSSELKDVLVGPQPVNYSGILTVDLFKGDEKLETDSDRRLGRGEDYEVRIAFAGRERSGGRSPGSITVAGGADLDYVPFRIVVDFGIVKIPPEERIFEAPRTETLTLSPIRFRVPDVNAPDEERIAKGQSELPNDVSVLVYQHSMFVECVTVDTWVLL